MTDDELMDAVVASFSGTWHTTIYRHNGVLIVVTAHRDGILP